MAQMTHRKNIEIKMEKSEIINGRYRSIRVRSQRLQRDKRLNKIIRNTLCALLAP